MLSVRVLVDGRFEMAALRSGGGSLIDPSSWVPHKSTNLKK